MFKFCDPTENTSNRNLKSIFPLADAYGIVIQQALHAKVFLAGVEPEKCFCDPPIDNQIYNVIINNIIYHNNRLYTRSSGGRTGVMDWFWTGGHLWPEAGNIKAEGRQSSVAGRAPTPPKVAGRRRSFFEIQQRDLFTLRTAPRWPSSNRWNMKLFVELHCPKRCRSGRSSFMSGEWWPGLPNDRAYLVLLYLSQMTIRQ